MGMDLRQFLATYAGGAMTDRVVLDLELTAPDPGAGRHYPMIILRHDPYVMVLEIMAMADHLSVDAHPFVEGRDARVGLIAMENGAQWGLTGLATPATSHDWPAASLLVLLLGAQTGPPLPPPPPDPYQSSGPATGGV
jgi:hypothetical protein